MIMKTIKKKIYFYSTQAHYEDQIQLDRTPMLKIGDTQQEEAEDRINQQDTTSNPQQLITKGVFETTFGDKEFHKHLLKCGYKKTRDDKDREWFYITVEDAIYELEQYQGSQSVSKIAETRELFKHQKEFVTKIMSTWEQWKEFLLFAKCRAGKSTMVLSAIVNSGVKVTLVVSRYKSPEQSWREDSNLKNFENLVYIDLNKNDYEKEIEKYLKTNKQLILWGCIQSRKLKNLPCNVDLIVYDEAHIGYGSKQWTVLQNSYDCKVLYVTGTAYKMVWDFNNFNRYIYSYYEEQLDKKRGLINRPSMKVVLAKYDSAQYQSLFGDDPDAMKNLFRVDDEGNFVEPSLVQDFVANHFETQRTLRPQHRLLKDSTHLYMTLPSVAACHAISKYMEGTRFAPLVVTGDTGKDAEDINLHITQNPNGSCILTRTANVLGVTASKIDTIINCAEGSSIEFWTQFAFRGGSSDEDWTVIDFCPQRCLESLRQTFIAACDTSPEIAEYDFTDYIVISEWNQGFETLSTEKVNEILAADVGNAIRLVSGLVTSLDYGKLRELDFNLSLAATNSNIVKSIQLNDNNANGKSNKRQVSELQKSDKDEIYQKIETIQAILERVPLVLFHAINSGESMNNIDSVLESGHYHSVTLDDENILKMALDYGIINRKSLSTRISKAYVDVQHSMQKDKIVTLDKLSKSTQAQQGIPVELFEEMLNV
jgi:hypothetical protein